MAGKSVEITHGSGTPVAVDEPTTGEAEGVKLQRIKLMSGAAGSATDVSEAAPLPVNDAGGSLTVDSTALGTTAEAEVTGSGGIVGLLKRLRKLLEGSGTIGLVAGTAEIGKVKVTEVPSVPAGSNSIGTVILGAGTAEAGKVKVTELPSLILAAGTAAIGKVIVSKLEEALPAGTNNIGKVTVAVIEAGTNAIGKLAPNAGVNIGSVGLLPQTTGGVEPKLVVSAASTNSTIVKNAAGQVFGWHIANKESVWVWVKLYNIATAPTVGTTAQVMAIGIPPGGAANVEFTNGIPFATGIGLGITKGPATGNTEAVASEGVVVNLLFK